MYPMSTEDPVPTRHYRADSQCFAEDSIGYLLKQVYVSMNRMIDRDMAPLDLTAMQWRPLILIARGKADTAAELARLADIDTGAMTRTLDRLQAKGLLHRVRSQQDRRVVKLELTQAGHEAASRIPAVIAQVLNRHLRGFDATEAAQLRHFLLRMLANGSEPG